MISVQKHNKAILPRSTLRRRDRLIVGSLEHGFVELELIAIGSAEKTFICFPVLQSEPLEQSQGKTGKTRASLSILIRSWFLTIRTPTQSVQSTIRTIFYNMACTIEMGLDPSHQLSEGDIHDYELPDEIGDNWRDLARALGYKEAQIRSIEKEKRNSNKECCIEILVRWLHEKGKDATAGKLAEALAKIKLQSLAEKLVKPNDQSQFEKTLALLREDNSKMSDRIRKAEEEGSKMRATIKELKEKDSINSVRIKELEEEGSKMRATIKELEEKNSKLQERIKDELEDASEQGQKHTKLNFQPCVSLRSGGEWQPGLPNRLEIEPRPLELAHIHWTKKWIYRGDKVVANMK